MIVNTNDLKSSCRAMLISAKQSKSGGSGGEIKIPDVPDPPSWIYPSDWIAQPVSADAHHITGVICIKKGSANRSVSVSLWAKSGETSLGFMTWGDQNWESIEKTSSSSSSGTWGTLTHTYSEGSGHPIYINNEAYEQWKFEISLYNFGDYSDDNPVYFAGFYEQTAYIERPSIQWLSIGDNIKLHLNGAGYFSNVNRDQYRLFGREFLLKYAEIGDGCTLLTRTFEPVQGLKSSLVEVNLKGSISIPSYCFSACSSLKKITGSEFISNISSYALDSCSSLTKLVADSANLASVPQGCTSLQLLSAGNFDESGFKVCFYKS